MKQKNTAEHREQTLINQSINQCIHQSLKQHHLTSKRFMQEVVPTYVQCHPYTQNTFKHPNLSSGISLVSKGFKSTTCLTTESRSQPHFRKDGCRPRKMGLAHFATFLGLADSALPGFWLANQIARKYYIMNSIHIIIIIIVRCDLY